MTRAENTGENDQIQNPINKVTLSVSCTTNLIITANFYVNERIAADLLRFLFCFYSFLFQICSDQNESTMAPCSECKIPLMINNSCCYPGAHTSCMHAPFTTTKQYAHNQHLIDCASTPKESCFMASICSHMSLELSYRTCVECVLGIFLHKPTSKFYRNERGD